MLFYANVSYSGGYGTHIEAKSHEEAYSLIAQKTKNEYCQIPTHTSIELNEIKIDKAKESAALLLQGINT